jgi:RHS repeat-associated protein
LRLCRAKAYDGNGNVAALVDGSTGATTARYEYGPFGEPVRVTGTMGETNPIRFSSKYTDKESGFLYYGYRFYDPAIGRWINRDPMGERGGQNLHAFVANNPLSLIDSLGDSPLDVVANQIRLSLSLGEEANAAAQAKKLYEMLIGAGQLVEPLAAKLMENWLKGAPLDPYIISPGDVKNAMLDKSAANGAASPNAQTGSSLCKLLTANQIKKGTGTLTGKRFQVTATAGKYYHAFGTFTIVFTGTFDCNCCKRKRGQTIYFFVFHMPKLP